MRHVPFKCAACAVLLHPEGFLARGTAPDPDIPKNVTGARWYEVTGIWWNTVEQLSWTMLGKSATYGISISSRIIFKFAGIIYLLFGAQHDV